MWHRDLEPNIEEIGKRNQAARAAHNWPEAIQLTRQLLKLLSEMDYRIKYHQGNLAEYLLYSGNLDEAKAGYLQLLAAKSESSASYGLARVAAERGDFTSGLYWVERYDKTGSRRCGNCNESRHVFIHRLTTVWKAAMQPHAETSLRHIIAGRFRPVQERHRKKGELEQLEEAAQEARLLLAESLVRQKRISEGKSLFKNILRRVPEEEQQEDMHFILAEAHLKKLG